ncbi:MAG: glycosyltransferase [Patescibacteria group bacterium]|nr:glycosyltransferase [Patescibacteria group bacterium]
MKVALVHDFLVKNGGAERVLAVLAKMYPKAPIYTLIYDEKVCGDIFPKNRVRPSHLQKWSKYFSHRSLAPFYAGAVEKWDFSEFDVVISSSNAFAHGIVTPTHTKHICYYHSPMRYAWDWTNEYRDENHMTGFKGGLWTMFLKKLRMWDRLAAERPDIVIANSENVAKRIWKYYRREADVIYPPVDVRNFRLNEKHEDYFLIVSTLSPYKRVDLAVQLFNKIKKKLIVIGDGSEKKNLQEMAGRTVEILGHKSDDVVKEYVENCKALIFPGEEDFGITPVEAQACGKPVLAYGGGGVLESVIAGKTGEFFDEPNIASMEDALGKLIGNYKKYKPGDLRKQARKFSESVFKKKVEEIV